MDTTEPAERQVMASPAAATGNSLGEITLLQERLHRIAAPMLINGVDLCKNQVRNLLGFTAKNKYSYTKKMVDTAQTDLGYGERLQISTVLTDSGAERAGLRKGDGLVAAEDRPFATGPNAEALAARMLSSMLAQRTSLNITVERDGAFHKLGVPTTRACAFRIHLGNADNINSYADGRRISITRGMATFAQDDESLAFVIAKGMAHNILDHATRQHASAALRDIIDKADSAPWNSPAAAGRQVEAMPPELDVAADRLALQILARAGYDTNNVAQFWQRLADHLPASVPSGYTAAHPDTAARIAAIHGANAGTR